MIPAGDNARHSGQAWQVSAVVAWRDDRTLLEATLASLSEGNEPRHVIVVTDREAPPGAFELSLAPAARARVQLFRMRSGRAPEKWNSGALCAAEDDALLFLRAGDVVVPGSIEGLVAALPPGGFALGAWESSGTGEGRRHGGPGVRRLARAAHDPLERFLWGWRPPTSSTLWTRDAFERAGRWDDSLEADQDWDLPMRALALGIPVGRTVTGVPSLAPSVRRGAPPHATEEALASQLRVVEKVQARLEWEDRLVEYRAPLRSALRVIRRGAQEAREDATAHRAAQLHRGLDGPGLRLQEILGEARVLSRGARRRVRDGEATERAVAPLPAPATDDAHPVVLPAVDTELPLVSVVLPTYERADVLRGAIGSVLGQTFTDFELFVVDDGSTDGTAAVVESFDDSRVRYFHQPNRGVSAARNHALRKARGRYVAFIDSDDVWRADKLQRQIEALHGLPETVGLLYGGVRDLERDGSTVLHVPTHRGDLECELGVRNVIHGTSGVLMRRAVIATVGFFDEEIPAAEDWDYWFRAARFTSVDYIEEPMIEYDNTERNRRKTLDVSANLDARDVFLSRHRLRLRAIGCEVEHLVVSTRRNLRHGSDRRRARSLSRSAVRRAPTDPSAWRAFVGARLPRAIGRTRRSGGPGRSDRLKIHFHCGVDLSESGGVQTVLHRLRRGLRERGHRTSESWSRCSDTQPSELGNVEIIRLAVPRGGIGLDSLRSVLSSARTFARLSRLLGAERPDVVNVHYVQPGAVHFLVLRRVFGYAIVLSVHGSDLLVARDPAHKRRLDRALAGADAITTVSEELALHALSVPGVTPDRVSHIPNGIDHDFWRRPPEAHGARRATLVNVGRLRLDHKGQDLLLRSFARTIAAGHDAELVLVGDGPARDELESLVEALDLAERVRFAGAVDASVLRDLLHRADGFVLASHREGLPMSLLEAMSAGLPVVVTSVGSMAEVVVEGTGWVVRPADEAEMARALASLLSDRDRREHMGQAAARRARDFVADHVDERYEQVFRSVVR